MVATTLTWVAGLEKLKAVEVLVLPVVMQVAVIPIDHSCTLPMPELLE